MGRRRRQRRSASRSAHPCTPRLNWAAEESLRQEGGDLRLEPASSLQEFSLQAGRRRPGLSHQLASRPRSYRDHGTLREGLEFMHGAAAAPAVPVPSVLPPPSSPASLFCWRPNCTNTPISPCGDEQGYNTCCACRCRVQPRSSTWQATTVGLLKRGTIEQASKGAKL